MRSGQAGQRAEQERGSREEAAAYVASLSRDLSDISRRHGLVTLAYLLDMARLEADMAARGGAAGGGPPSDPGVDLA